MHGRHSWDDGRRRDALRRSRPLIHLVWLLGILGGCSTVPSNYRLTSEHPFSIGFSLHAVSTDLYWLPAFDIDIRKRLSADIDLGVTLVPLVVVNQISPYVVYSPKVGGSRPLNLFVQSPTLLIMNDIRSAQKWYVPIFDTGSLSLISSLNVGFGYVKPFSDSQQVMLGARYDLSRLGSSDGGEFSYHPSPLVVNVGYGRQLDPTVLWMAQGELDAKLNLRGTTSIIGMAME